LNFLNIALGSLGESVSGLHGYRNASQITEGNFEMLDKFAFKLENGLLKLVESLEKKKLDGDWIDTLVVKESNDEYAKVGKVNSKHSKTRHSITPSLQRGILWIFFLHFI
jgi:hypothetical protein